jgi:hypothetical protein
MSQDEILQSKYSGLFPQFSLPGLIRSILTFLFIAVVAAISLNRLRPPAAIGQEAPITEFSAERAVQHLKLIAQKPRPVGSAEHELVRNYLVDQITLLGLKPEIQAVGNIANIIARLKGKGDGKAVLVMGHYDTVPSSPGAADNGYSVASMLETLRALKAGAPLDNDVITLFSDGEELGLLGAKAFVYKHPWIKDVGLILNFDARGNRGPILMFETSGQNGWGIRQFAKADPFPVANSLMYEIYKRLPNDTDFTVFKREGYAGLNFACINGFFSYHTPLDHTDSISDRTVQSLGSHMLSLTRHFTKLNLDANREPDAVYFDLLGAMLIEYPGRWTIPLTILVSLLFIGVVYLGTRRKRLSVSGVGLGFLALLLSMMGVAAVLISISMLVNVWGKTSRLFFDIDTNQGRLYALGLLAITIATISALHIWFRKRVRVENLAVGGALLWLLLLVFGSVFLPGASYLFAWPLFFTLLGIGYLLAVESEISTSVKKLAVISVCAIPGIILLAPLTYLILAALTLKNAHIVMMLVVLLFGLLIPHLSYMTAPHRWLFPGMSALIGLALIFAAG